MVTAHRRESFGDGFENICAALAELAQRDDVQIVYPVHRNPNVLDPVNRQLGNLPNVFLVPPLDYVPFVDLMRRAYLLISDSGGVQEEAPSLGKPILVLRDKTERPEAVEAATATLVGTDPARIVREANLLLDDADEYARRRAFTILTAMDMPVPGLARQSVHSSKPESSKSSLQKCKPSAFR